MSLPEYTLDSVAASEPAAPVGPTEEEKAAAYQTWSGDQCTQLRDRKHPVYVYTWCIFCL